MSAPAFFCPHCATPNAPGAGLCANTTCARPLPRGYEPHASRAVAAPLDAVEADLVRQKAEVKHPGLAAFLALVLPSLGAFYNGKLVVGLLLLVGEVFLWIVGAFVFEIPVVLYRIAGAIVSYKWARTTNIKELERLIAARKAIS